MNFNQKQLLKCIVPILIVLVWHFVSTTGNFSPLLMPTLSGIKNAFLGAVQSGVLLSDLLESIWTVMRGFAAGAILGLLLGILMGFFTSANFLFNTTLNAFRQIPPLAWIPLLILWFGIDETSRIILISLSSFFPVLLNTSSGIHEVSGKYLEFAENYKIKKRDILFKILLPAAFPSIFVGLRLGAGTAWMSIVAAEMIAATAGVGYRINSSRNLLRTDTIIVYMILIGIVGGGMDYLIRNIGSYFTRWNRS
jgi:sulfonate transport system permease protein